MKKRQLKYCQAINEAIDQSMAQDENVYIMGLGVPDPRGVFGTTLGLQEKYGSERVMDMPTSENGMTGVAIGSALVGRRPIMVHQRVDFALLAVEQLVNQAAKWHYTFKGEQSIPLVVRMMIGRGWGQGPQHAQSLQSWFAHIPGLKVVMPTTPYDAKGLLIASIEDDNPVIFLEHRWLHNITGYVPEEYYRVPLSQARIKKEGNDLTIVATSYMSLEALKASEILEDAGISAEVVDVRTLKPLDEKTICDSIQKTGRLIVADTGWKTCGFTTEIITLAVEQAFDVLKTKPIRIASPDCPSPSSRSLASEFYPRAKDIVIAAKEMMGVEYDEALENLDEPALLDIPDKSFAGPF